MDYQSLRDLIDRVEDCGARGDYPAALTAIDQELARVFADEGGPETPAAAVEAASLASRKGRLLLEMTTIRLVRRDDDGNDHVEPAIDGERRREFAEQGYGWLQVGLAAAQRGLGSGGAPHDDPARSDESEARALLHAALGQVRRAYLQASDSGAAPWLPGQAAVIRHLFSLLWLEGDLAGAEDLLYLLAEIEGRPALAVTAHTFYDELADYPDQRLEAGGLSRAEIASARADWNDPA